MPLIELETAVNLVNELNEKLTTQEHPLRGTDGIFIAATDGYNVYITFEDIHIFNDNSEWTDEEDRLPIEQLILTVAKKTLFAHMNTIEAAINVIENKQQTLEEEQNQ